MKLYDELFESYVEEMRSAINQEMQRLTSFIEKNKHRFKTDEELSQFLGSRFDPVYCSGRVIAVFRKYWLLCENNNVLNKQNALDEYVNPRELTVDWLCGKHDDIYRIIEAMPYYPIGIDENGDYC